MTIYRLSVGYWLVLIASRNRAPCSYNPSTHGFLDEHDIQRGMRLSRKRRATAALSSIGDCDTTTQPSTSLNMLCCYSVCCGAGMTHAVTNATCFWEGHAGACPSRLFLNPPAFPWDPTASGRQACVSAMPLSCQDTSCGRPPGRHTNQTTCPT